ncbi:DUF1275 domain-containing protein [Tianweitania sp. BSSL-BM11]|uniref:DUF1275 domain-containing protein n=1 Tax=Tianweitania aestuarii TaxID=2814886 RepID=A0ABS5RUJ5_9HYPH|nr:YoaK family protein [Tianweitania aestuarii]MBS9720455.1 DUF1275 domain-containing protein [Tianweitania aestuarii]
MLVTEGAARDDRRNRQLAGMLAAIAGGLNAAAFHAVGFFAANMTGNVSLLSDHLAIADLSLAGFFLLIVLSFVTGSALSTLLINAGRRRGNVAIYAHSILLEGAILAAVGLGALLRGGPPSADLIVISLSFLMGLQNAVVTRISQARVRTTHVSGMLTDIGIGLGMLVDIARGVEPQDGAAETRARLRLHLETVAAFLLGGVVGVVLYQRIGSGSLLLAAALLLLIGWRAVLKSRSPAA